MIGQKGEVGVKYRIYTDGACSGNHREKQCVGGCAYIILEMDDPTGSKVVFSDAKKHTGTTNNRMEMQAVVNGLTRLLETVGSKCEVVVVSDSKYIVDNYNDYLEEWIRSGWKKLNGKPVMNCGLWEQIYKLSKSFKKFEFEWVKGHDSDEINQYVDAMATSIMKVGDK
jgi:ribonuclease HI